MRIQFNVRRLLLVCASVALVASVVFRLLWIQPPSWTTYSPAVLHEALLENQAVLITVSADWDPICHIHERTAISSIESYRTIRNHGLLTLRADWTNHDSAVTQLMKDVGLSTVPAFLIYSPKLPNDPIVLRDAVSAKDLVDAICYNAIRISP